MDTPLYATPQTVDSPESCFFYHFMDLPELGTVGSTWDLRECSEDYLGRLDYQGKRVLDVGTAGGFLTFEMEKRGADVVSFDLPGVEAWNLVPHYSLQSNWDRVVSERSKGHQRLRNAYWYAHRALNSRAKVHYGDVYNLPKQLGNFDVVFLGMILPHLRDPFQALFSASRLAADRLIVTNPGSKTSWLGKWIGRKKFQAKFQPSKDNATCDVWWALSDTCIIRMLETLGFEVTDQISCRALCHENGTVRSRNNQAIVAKRVAGRAEGIAPTAQAA